MCTVYIALAYLRPTDWQTDNWSSLYLLHIHQSPFYVQVVTKVQISVLSAEATAASQNKDCRPPTGVTQHMCRLSWPPRVYATNLRLYRISQSAYKSVYWDTFNIIVVRPSGRRRREKVKVKYRQNEIIFGCSGNCCLCKWIIVF